jgi:hypothetical protein
MSAAINPTDSGAEYSALRAVKPNTPSGCKKRTHRICLEDDIHMTILEAQIEASALKKQGEKMDL